MSKYARSGPPGLEGVQQQRNAHEAGQRAEQLRRQEQDLAQHRERDHGDDYGL